MILRDATRLVLAGARLGLAANAASPPPAELGADTHSAAERGGGTCGVAGAPAAATAARIGVEEARGLCDACRAGFVDARSGREFAAGHVTGALHLPPEGHPGEAAALETLRQYPLVVVYDGDYRCALADEVAARLARAGLRDVRVLEGAWPAWLAAGGPGTSGACPACHAGEGAP